MAAPEQSTTTTVLIRRENSVDSSGIVAVSESDIVNNEVVSEDILRRAIEEATDGLTQNAVHFPPQNSIIVSLADGNSQAGNVTLIADESGNIVGQVANDSILSEVVAGSFGEAVTSSQQELHETEIEHVESVVTDNGNVDITECVSRTSTSNVDDASNDSSNINPSLVTVDLNTSSAVSQKTPNVISNNLTIAPLGSSQNPIRIVQQGNQYTSLQQLSPEQLAHIMQVVQQQQVTKTAEENSGSSILFNPQTQTRIVYKVIYPSELHARKGSNDSNALITTVTKNNIPSFCGQLSKYRRRKHDLDDRIEGPELSKAEKDLKKKHRPRTRSGRVSRPPVHMVKDYKHIHPVDWDDDYDDSDGGYSDYRVSDEEGCEVKDKPRMKDSDYYPHMLGTLKPKNWKCETCGRCYIGRAGLSRHFRLNPDHGRMENENYADEVGSIEQDSSTQDSAPDLSAVSTPITSDESSLMNSTPITFVVTSITDVKPTPAVVSDVMPPVKPKRGRGRPPLYSNVNPELRRKARLSELTNVVKKCEDQDLIDVVLPRLYHVISAWEYMMMKVGKGKPRSSHFTDVYREFTALHQQLKKMCGEYLKPASAVIESPQLKVNQFQVSDEPVAESLGLSAGVYDVTEAFCDDPFFQSKILTSTPCNHPQVNGSDRKRTIDVISPDKLLTPRAKRPKLEPSTNFVGRFPNSHKLSQGTISFSSSEPVAALNNGVVQPSHVIRVTSAGCSQSSSVQIDQKPTYTSQFTNNHATPTKSANTNVEISSTENKVPQQIIVKTVDGKVVSVKTAEGNTIHSVPDIFKTPVKKECSSSPGSTGSPSKNTTWLSKTYDSKTDAPISERAFAAIGTLTHSNTMAEKSNSNQDSPVLLHVSESASELTMRTESTDIVRCFNGVSVVESCKDFPSPEVTIHIPITVQSKPIMSMAGSEISSRYASSSACSDRIPACSSSTTRNGSVRLFNSAANTNGFIDVGDTAGREPNDIESHLNDCDRDGPRMSLQVINRSSDVTQQQTPLPAHGFNLNHAVMQPQLAVNGFSSTPSDTQTQPTVNGFSSTPNDTQTQLDVNDFSSTPNNTHTQLAVNDFSSSSSHTQTQLAVNDFSSTPSDTQTQLAVNDFSSTPNNTHTQLAVNDFSSTPSDTQTQLAVNDFSSTTSDTQTQLAVNVCSSTTSDTQTQLAVNSFTSASDVPHEQTQLAVSGFNSTAEPLVVESSSLPLSGGGDDGATLGGQFIAAAHDEESQIFVQGDPEDGQQIISHTQLYQTEDGLLLFPNPDGTFSIAGQCEEGVQMETIEALLTMNEESEGRPLPTDPT